MGWRSPSPFAKQEAKTPSTKSAVRRVNAASLAGLGVERLAELLADAAKADPVLKRALTLEVAIGPERLAEEIDRQVTRLRTARGRLTAVRAAKLAREVGSLVEVAAETLGGMDATAGVLRLFEILSLGPPLLNRRTGEGGPLLETLLSIPERAAALVARMVDADQKLIVGPMHQTFLADADGVAARLPPQVAAVLQPEARRMLRDLVEADIASSAGASRDLVRLTTVLGQIADAEGDVDAFLAAQQRRAASLRDHVGSARRLLDAGRVADAAALLQAAPAGAASSSAAFAEIRIEVLDRSGAGDEAQAARWRLFQAALSAQVLRRHLSRMPDFEDVEREEEALDYVQAHADATAALGFLIAWPSLRRAAALVRTRAARLDGSARDVLQPAADALVRQDPLAATLVLRAMINATLQNGGRRDLARAGSTLAECAALARLIPDWEGRTDHHVYVASLRSRHARKSAFWKSFTTAGAG